MSLTPTSASSVQALDSSECNEDFVQDLKGHSGCSIRLLRSDDGYFVRKVSGSTTYNSRLIKQIEKQRRLQDIIPLPKLLGCKENDGLVSFDMDFVAGRDFYSHCLQEPAAWIYQFVDQLFRVMSQLIVPNGQDVTPDAFARKCSEISDRIRVHNPVARHSNEIANALSVLRSADWTGIPQTDNHGDLTLENIILCGHGNICFIDVLDSELETTWLDFAKLLFDLEIGWSLRSILWNNENTTHEVRLVQMLSRYLREEILARLRTDYPGIIPRLVQLKLLQAMRIIPYSEDEKTILHLVGYLANITTESELTQ